jgi:4'-phosphopantetheinyl transferase
LDLERDPAIAAWPGGPERAVATAAELHVWRAELDEEGRPGPEGLPAAERERAQRIRRPESSARWAAARWALRLVLGRYLDEDPAAIELEDGAHGKPQLAAGPDRLAFNLSHSGGLALVAVTAGCEVGVDVERVAPDRDLVALARRELDPAAAAAVAAAAEPERAELFFAAWTRHEARLKCLGVGLGGPRSERAVAISALDPAPGYAGAVAVPGGAIPRLRLWTLRWADDRSR